MFTKYASMMEETKYSKEKETVCPFSENLTLLKQKL